MKTSKCPIANAFPGYVTTNKKISKVISIVNHVPLLVNMMVATCVIAVI